MHLTLLPWGSFETGLWVFQIILPASSVLTGGAIYCLVSSVSPIRTDAS